MYRLGPIAILPKERREIKKREKMVKDDKDLKRPEEVIFIFIFNKHIR